MSDSDDDWFLKDLNEFVVHTPKADDEHIKIKVSDTDTTTSTKTAYIDSGLL